MQLGPGTASLACARLIVPFAPFNVVTKVLQVPKPGVQIKDMVFTRLRLETMLWYTGL